MVKPVLGKSVRSEWFFLGWDFAVRHGNGPSRLFLFWSKAGKKNLQPKQRKRNANIVILYETTRKSKKDWNFTEISKMDEEDEHSLSEV